MTYMILFEAEPNPGREEEYFEIAKGLADELERQPGFLSIDRARSVMNEGRLLSLSFWESEEAIAAWYAQPNHREAQRRGKEGIFKFIRITRLQVLASREIDTAT